MNQSLEKPRLGWLAVAVAAAAAVGSAGCSNMAGIAGETNYGCKAPPGVRCESMSATYVNALQGGLPSQQSRQGGAAPAAGEGGAKAIHDNGAANGGGLLKLASMPPAGTGPAQDVYGPAPIRSQSTVLRLWFKPWEDADRDMWDQGYVYVVVDSGRWLVDHAQRRVRDAYLPIRPPSNYKAEAAAPDRPVAPTNRTAGGATFADTPFAKGLTAAGQALPERD